LDAWVTCLGRIGIVLLLWLGLMAGTAFAQCRQALALGLDVSGSVDGDEYRLQLDGLAAALIDPDVRRALLAPAVDPVYLTVFEWSGPGYQRILLDWTALTDRDTLFRVAQQLANRARVPAPRGTALGSAMLYGANLLTAGPNCWTHTLDLSGDGKSNVGPHPRDAQSVLSIRRLTLNALVIGADAPAIGDTRQVEIAELSAYFSAWVITGPDAFVETALGFADYQAAMTRKLLRELETLAVSSLWGISNAHPGTEE
jgi:hypothetical protein